jgi:hypothetical protein
LGQPPEVFAIPKLVVEVAGGRAGRGLLSMSLSEGQAMSDNRYYVKSRIVSARIGVGYTDHRQMKSHKVQSATKRLPRPIGTGKGDFVVPDDFDDPLPKEIEDEFYQVDDLLEESLRALRDSVVKGKPLGRRR